MERKHERTEPFGQAVDVPLFRNHSRHHDDESPISPTDSTSDYDPIEHDPIQHPSTDQLAKSPTTKPQSDQPVQPNADIDNQPQNTSKIPEHSPQNITKNNTSPAVQEPAQQQSSISEEYDNSENDDRLLDMYGKPLPSIQSQLFTTLNSFILDLLDEELPYQLHQDHSLFIDSFTSKY